MEAVVLDGGEMGFTPFEGLDAPLLWVHELGSGHEVSLIPRVGMVFFYDEKGPVFRAEDIQLARWWVFGKGNEKRVRITCLKVGDHFAYLLPGIPGAVICDSQEHPDCEPWQCAYAGAVGLALLADGVTP